MTPLCSQLTGDPGTLGADDKDRQPSPMCPVAWAACSAVLVRRGPGGGHALLQRQDNAAEHQRGFALRLLRDGLESNEAFGQTGHQRGPGGGRCPQRQLNVRCRGCGRIRTDVCAQAHKRADGIVLPSARAHLDGLQVVRVGPQCNVPVEPDGIRRAGRLGCERSIVTAAQSLGSHCCAVSDTRGRRDLTVRWRSPGTILSDIAASLL